MPTAKMKCRNRAAAAAQLGFAGARGRPGDAADAGESGMEFCAPVLDATREVC